MKRWAWIILFIPVGLYIPNINHFAFPIFSQYSDLLITHWPNAYWINQSIITHHQIPLWSSTILAGYPFFANPLSGLWYLPGWFANIFPSALAFNLLFLFHIIAGALGVYVLIRDSDYPVELAVMGGIAFEMMPKLWAHFAQGHVTLIYAFCLTPWLIVASRKSISLKPRYQYWLIQGMVIAGIIIADPRWTMYALLIWAIDSLFTFRKKIQKSDASTGKMIGHFLVPVTVGILLSAVLILPMMQYAELSTRSLMTLQDNLAFSLPILKLPLILFSSFGITAEWVFYLGGLGVISLSMALMNREIRNRSASWLILFGLGIFLAISGSIPGFSNLWSLPGLNLVRVPSRSLFVCGIAACFLIAEAIDSVFSRRFHKKRTNLMLAGWFCLGIIVLAVSILMEPPTNAGLLHGGVSLVFFTSAIWLIINRDITQIRWVWLLTIALLIDFSLFNLAGIKFENSTAVFEKGATFLSKMDVNDKTGFRVFSPSDSFPQQTAALHGLELVNGIDPLQLQSIHRYLNLQDESGQQMDENYSVTFPPFQTGNPETDNRSIKLDIQKFRILGVRYFLSAFPLKHEELKFVAQTPEGFLYEDPNYYPRAWVQESRQEVGADLIEIPDIYRTPNKIIINTEGPGTLILSEVFYPGWSASIDGKPAEIFPREGIFRSIELPPGEHEIKFFFSPSQLWIGLGVTVLSLVLSIAAYLILRCRYHD